jgi:dTDP-4-dehydrorhamnose reductase
VSINTINAIVVGADRSVGYWLTRALATENCVYRGQSFESRERLQLQSGGMPFCLLLPSIYSREDFVNLDYWVEQAIEQDVPILMLSSLSLFGEAAGKPLVETNTPDLDVERSRRLHYAEEAARASRRHLILRLGQPLSLQPGDIAHELLTEARDSGVVRVDDQATFSPTPDDDVAKVVMAMIKQAGCTDQLWGTYHFSGVEPVTTYAFAEALLAEARQYEDLSNVLLESAEHWNASWLRVPNGDSTRIFHAFGIKAKPWRNGLGRLVRQKYRPS